MFNEDMLSV